MKFNLCRMKPKTPLHLGEREYWQEGSSAYIHSDTIFSAFCNGYGLLYGQDALNTVFLDKFKDNPIFTISSAFPYWEDVLYFPVPFNQFSQLKEVRKIQFVEKVGFERMLKGERLENIYQSIKTIPGRIKPQYPWELENIPRVTLNRRNNHPTEEGGFFHSGRVVYRKNAGLFFLVQFNDSTFQKLFQGVMNLMADEGFGGDRSVGSGLMEKPIFEQVDIDVPDSSNGNVILSLYFPKTGSKEFNQLDQSYYELLNRKGYIFSPQNKSYRRKSVRMFKEASLFPSDVKRKGELVDVCPEVYKDQHPVYRYGYFMGVPCNMEGFNNGH
jgi:CRISPR-associated protein Csm4